ncbi:hypothetical protein H072_4677 [Dactylellina haptotyla CBS 200.50]|uniref:F-box domain-containing protein n=1 Tax=Dactylellina haptotyla (strain CBS 200.50) TaxID=1284197 RepID=S8BPQ4_DACHA|nr:hypothetical protein H072_4677 [Dactylellina haptotyla CBS 200.50]
MAKLAKKNTLHLPTELWLEIYSYLHLNDTPSLKALSSCTRQLREWAIPLLFTDIKLSRDSIAAFNRGRFSHLRSLVINVSFDKLVNPDASRYPQHVKLVQRYCYALGLFPNIAGLRIRYSTISDFDWVIPQAVFRRIAEYPWYPTLKRLHVESVPIEIKDAGYVAAADIIKGVSEVDREFFRENTYSPQRWDTMDMRYPEQLEEATTTGLVRQWNYWFDLHIYNRGNAGVSQYFFLRSGNTLKKLKIHTGFILGGGECRCGQNSKQPFPTVEELEVLLEGKDVERVMAVARTTFPNVRVLRIDAVNPNTRAEGRFVYTELGDLKHLREARVPWPLVEVGYQARRAWPSQLRRFVDEWIATGAGDIERVDFVWGYEPVLDVFYHVYESNVPTGEDVKICRVAPKEGKRYNITERGNRVGNTRFMEREAPPPLEDEWRSGKWKRKRGGLGRR